MTPVSDCSDFSNCDDGEFFGEKSGSLTALPTSRFMSVDDDNKLPRCVANGNNQSQYSLNMIDRFIKDTSNQFTSFERQKDSETKSIVLPYPTPKYACGENQTQLPRATVNINCPRQHKLRCLKHC